jgi:hypothetical protein
MASIVSAQPKLRKEGIAETLGSEPHYWHNRDAQIIERLEPHKQHWDSQTGHK